MRKDSTNKVRGDVSENKLGKLIIIIACRVGKKLAMSKPLRSTSSFSRRKTGSTRWIAY